MHDRITINGKPYISVESLQQMRASILSELSAMLSAAQEVEAKPVQQELPLSVEAEPMKPVSEKEMYMQEIIRQVRHESVPTSALLSQKCVIENIDKETKTVTFKLARPFVEQFNRTPAKRELLFRATRRVLWGDARVKLVAMQPGETIDRIVAGQLGEAPKPKRLTDVQAKVYRAWIDLENQIKFGKRKDYCYADVQAISGVSKAGTHGALMKLKDLKLVNLNNIRNRRTK